MWSLVILLCITISWAEAQNGRGPQHQDHNGHGWDIRLAVPGEPGSDYPTLGAIPRTSFSCAGREPGYYADIETNCQVFRVCTVGSTYGFQSFLCPNGTLFNQAVFVCDWWMNVDCKNSQQFINNNNEKFENLRLGPQLMKDIKKMLTHPMLNPYDKSVMKSNLIVMQDYKPPVGQLFPNGALLAGPERPPNNVYIPSKQIQQSFIQGNNDYSYSASTPDPRYLPVPVNNNFGSFQSNEDFFQRQRQSEQSTRNGRIQSAQITQNPGFISNGHAGRFVQNTNTDLNTINGYSQAQQAPRPTQISNFPQRQSNAVQTSQVNSVQSNQRGQVNRQRAQYTEPRKITQSNNNKESADFGVTFTKSQNNLNSDSNQDRQPYSYSTPSASLPQFSNIVSGKAGRELKENLALVYSFLTDSINVAREYTNIAQQEVLSSTAIPTPAQFQNLNNEQLSDITNKISQLTTSQFSSNLKQSNEQSRARQLQTPLYNAVSSQNTQSDFYSSRYQMPNSQQNLQNNQNAVYSGQLYQWSVPERNTNQNNAADNLKQSSPQVEIIKAHTLPFSPAKLQLEPPNEPEQFASQESLTTLLNTENGISAQLQDKIVGTIPHPLEDNKLVTYKKDQSYYLYTKLDDNTIDQNIASNTQSSTNTQQNSKLTENTNTPDLVTFQLIPSVNYELEDEKEQQQILNAFQIDEFGAPRDITKPLIENNTERQLMTSSVDYSVEHPTASRRSDRYRIDGLYSGPSSYTAPQSSVGSLERRQDTQSNFNSRLEDFDNNNQNGYPKERPARQFIF